jgi:hypothetical protein
MHLMSADDTVGQGRLDQIPTEWSLLRLAHDSPSRVGDARNVLVRRYAKAIRNYVGALVRDEQDADEVAHEVVVKLLRGSFAKADPKRGRFRDLLIVATHNQVRTYWSRKLARPVAEVDLATVAARTEACSLEVEEAAVWRRAVLDQAWKALEKYEKTHPGSVAWSLLRLRADHPDADTEELAAKLAEKTGRTLELAAVRQQLRRCRLRFAEGLLEEIAASLDDASPERVEEELRELGLLGYVGDFLPDDWRTSGALRDEEG